jgi:hypothetical protein
VEAGPGAGRDGMSASYRWTRGDQVVTLNTTPRDQPMQALCSFVSSMEINEDA